INKGLLGGYKGIEGLYPHPLPPQRLRVEQLVGSRPIDALVISVGANDIGFSGIVKDCLIDPVSCVNDTGLNTQLLSDLNTLRSRYGQLAQCLSPGHTGLGGSASSVAVDTAACAKTTSQFGKQSIPPLSLAPQRVVISE